MQIGYFNNGNITLWARNGGKVSDIKDELFDLLGCSNRRIGDILMKVNVFITKHVKLIRVIIK